MTRRALALVLVLAWGLAALACRPAAAQVSADGGLKRARDRYEYGDYADAAKLLERLIDQGRLTSDAELVKAYRLLGLSYFYEDKREEARSAFVRLLSIEPDYRLDPFFNPPKVVEFFDQVKKDNAALLAPIRAQKRKVAEERRRQEEAQQRLIEEEARRRAALARRHVTGVSTRVMEKVVADHPYLLNWLPFGVGQFQNGETDKGDVLAAAEAVTGLASVIGFVTVAGLRTCSTITVPKGDLNDPTQTEVQCGIPPDNVGLARTMDRVKWIAGGAFWALVVYGIIDAHLHYQSTVVVSEHPILVTAPKPKPAPPSGAKTAPPSVAKPTPPPKAPASPSPSTAPAPTPSADLAPSLQLAPYVGPGGAGAVVTLRF